MAAGSLGRGSCTIAFVVSRFIGVDLCQTQAGRARRKPIVTSSKLSHRVLETEIMDDPGLDEGRHINALRGLSRLNRISAGAGRLWPPIKALAARLATDRLRLLDIAAGAGDIPTAIWRQARRVGLDLDILGLDISPLAVRFAEEQARRRQADVRFSVGDALAGDLPNDFDIVTCSLFLHHLTDDQVCRLLGSMAAAARQLVIISDLVRSRRNLWLVRLGSQLVTRSKVVHADGARSVKAAFQIDEIRDLAVAAGLRQVELTACFPCRFLLTWRRPP